MSLPDGAVVEVTILMAVRQVGRCLARPKDAPVRTQRLCTQKAGVCTGVKGTARCLLHCVMPWPEQQMVLQPDPSQQNRCLHPWAVLDSGEINEKTSSSCGLSRAGPRPHRMAFAAGLKSQPVPCNAALCCVLVPGLPASKQPALWLQVRKTYSAVVLGHLEGRGVIDVTLDTRPALTEYSVIQHGAVAGEGGAALPTTLVRLNPHTGGGRCCCARLSVGG